MLTPRALAVSSALVALVFLPSVSLASTAAETSSSSSSSPPCSSYSTRYAQTIEGVCVCTATAPCDEISSDYLALPSDQVGVFQTSQAGDRLAYSTIPLDNSSVPSTSGSSSSIVEIKVDASVTYQQVKGFGGAFTDSTTSNVYKLAPALQEKLVRAYFGDKGLQYTLGRVPIGSTDFSESIYSYNPVEGDLNMTNFSIDIDKSTATHKIEFIKRALAASSREIPLFASSWAPPAWMTRENRTQNSHVIGEPGEPYWKALALYYSRFFDEYKKEGIDFWAMTTQNEPNYQFAFLEWQQLRFTTEQERDFLKKDLGPLMKQNHPNVKIIMMDDQKDLLPVWNAALEDPESRQFVAGVGVHWYKNLDFISDAFGNFKELADFHAKYPDVFILATEACGGSMPDIIGTGSGVKLLQPAVIWKRAENYARDIINDLANFAVGWTDWNMVLDTTGGPTWVGNFVDAPILIDEKSGNEFYKQPLYYIMGHFAKFLPAGSVRVALSVSTQDNAVDKVAFQTPTGQLVVILQNRNNVAMDIQLNDVKGARTTSVKLPANAVQTILFAAPGSSSPTPVPAPTTTVPATTVPATSVPATSVPATTVPATTPCPLPTATEPAVTTPCPLPSPTAPVTTAPTPTPSPTRAYC